MTNAFDKMLTNPAPRILSPAPVPVKCSDPECDYADESDFEDVAPSRCPECGRGRGHGHVVRDWSPQIQQFSRVAVARHITAARVASAVFDEDCTPCWPPEPTESDETRFRIWWIALTGEAERLEEATQIFWTAFGDAALAAAAVIESGA